VVAGLSALVFAESLIDLQLDLGDLDGGSGRLGLGRYRSGRTGEPVVDQLLGIVLSDS
jgi:hypothetical protein